jgi:tetratricopeptide (TPR) repeat protein
MSDPLRTDISSTRDSVSLADRDTKIEALLLAGLEHYFGARYEQAINIWTRVLFLDRHHARAHAYIGRARLAQAECQRESEELLQQGGAALGNGDGIEARRLLEMALAQGAPSDQALALLDRLTRIEQGSASADASLTPATRVSHLSPVPISARMGWGAIGALTLIVVGASAFAAGAFRSEWRTALSRSPVPVTVHVNDAEPPLPRRGELALARARGLVAAGRLREGLVALDAVWPTDPEKLEADQLRAQVQRQLIDLMTNVTSTRDGSVP